MTEVALKWKRDRPGRQVTTDGLYAVERWPPGPFKGPFECGAIRIYPGRRNVAGQVVTHMLGEFQTMREAKACCQTDAEQRAPTLDKPAVNDDTKGVLGPPGQPPPPVYTGEEPWSIQTESGIFVDGIGPYEIRSPSDPPVSDQGVTADAGMTTRADTPLVPLAELFPDLIRTNLDYLIVENFGCPTCRARRGKSCRTKSGKTARRPHSKRLAKVQTPSDDELREVFALYVTRPCPKCGGTEIARYIELHRNKYFPSHRHHFHCANCDHPLGYYDKASRGPLPADAGVMH